ncbi:predicted protein [Meyerozyma guilliermondii ATCC 6260]|uniref:Uncharacterized protein n=1 Tax=Meyerozyma guilliermondii (strain ATCC 6260 / CBS 566 / DSM 6381 / JCM 1539 / NBRC 10279 / NRRL Y-324) TaxID=294746 RepID=A5DCC9_PICGU|nr:uncharacterized protein PGUG_00934 [Meyerozyma guilliermondii ATCC 6260]EDK36836.2 predicted protein [Meyerozyma guilliermondii ATCC 6260]
MKTPSFALIFATPIFAANVLNDPNFFPTSIPGITSFYSAFNSYVGNADNYMQIGQGLTTQPFYTEWVAEVKKHTQTSWYAAYLDALTGGDQLTEFDLNTAQLDSFASDLFTNTQLASLTSALSRVTGASDSDSEVNETTESDSGETAEDRTSDSGNSSSSHSHSENSSSGSGSGSSSRSSSGSGSGSGSSSAAASGSSSSKANGVSYAAPAGAVLGALAVALL